MTKARIMGWVVAGMLLAQPAFAAGEYELRTRIDKLERQLDSIQRAGGGADGTVGAARLGVRITELEDAIRRSGGRTEEVQYQIEQLRKEFTSFSEDVQLRLQTLEQSMPMPGMGAAGMPAPTGADATMPPATAATVAPMTPQNPAPTVRGERSMEEVVDEVSTPSAAATPAAPAMKFNSPQEHYSHAFTLINRAQYAEAEQVLRSFVQQHPKDKLAGNAFYWLGETYYVRENYLNAADAFRQGFESLPDGSKAPDNLLKLGMSLGKLTKKDQACVVLKQLQVKYKGKADAVLQRAARESDVLGCAQ